MCIFAAARLIIALFLGALSLPACSPNAPLAVVFALIPETVDIQYHSATTATGLISGAGQITVRVQVIDERTDHSEQIGRKKMGGGWQTAAISSARPVPAIVRQALVEELQKKGFRVGPSHITIIAEINKFFSDFKLTFFGADAVGEVTLSVQVRTSEGRILYTRILTGQAINGNILIMPMGSGRNARIALETALASVMSDLVSDQAFMRVVLDAGHGRVTTALPF